MTATDKVIAVSNLTEYFRDSVQAAMSNQCIDVDDHTAHYVVNLLTVFARSDALYEHSRFGFGLKPLALMLADAVDADSSEQRNASLRRLGDVSLFIAGVFSGSLARSPVDVDYYINMGETAYHSLADSVQACVRSRAFAAVFAELAEKFQPLVDVLGEVAEPGKSDADVLRLYEIWLRTGSTRALKALRELGVEPQQSTDLDYRH